MRYFFYALVIVSLLISGYFFLAYNELRLRINFIMNQTGKEISFQKEQIKCLEKNQAIILPKLLELETWKEAVKIEFTPNCRD